MILTERDRTRLAGVNADLIRVIEHAAAITDQPFTVLEGVRTLERQRALKASGASLTLDSRHLTGHAVDIAPLDGTGKVSWHWPLYHRLAPIIKRAAAEQGVAVEWGGDWKRFKDGPHWQLPKNLYP
jgi:peptidoglycan L-alanyl-D-glutamate endopeptidase CwlK